MKCTQTNFGGCGLSGIRVMAPFCLPSKTAKFPFPTMDYSPWSSKNLIDRNRLQKIMQVCVDVTCMYTDFGGRGLSSFGDTTTLKNSQISLSNHGLYSPWGSKNGIGSKNSCK